MGQSKMDNPENMAMQVAQDKGNQNKNTTQYVLDTICKQTQTKDMCPPTNNWR